MTELEKALAEIKALKEANAAKDLEITRLRQSMVSREEAEQLINIEKQNIEVVKDREKEKDDIIQKVTKENAEKDGVIIEQTQTINVQNKDLEHANQINELKTKENNELRSELKHTDYKLKTIIEHNKALSEQVKDHKELAQEWKIIVKEKSESLQKTIEELTIEKAKVSELTQKIGVHNHDGSSLWIQLEQEEIPNLGEGALENQNSD
jgi:myosin heavy subunit